MGSTNATAETSTEVKEKKEESKTTTKSSTKKTPEKKAEEKKVEATENAKLTQGKEEKKAEEEKVDAPDKEHKEKKEELPPDTKEEASLETLKATAPANLPAVSKNLDKVSSDGAEYPFIVNLTHPIATYRGPSSSLVGKSFGGKISVIGCTDNGFYCVSFVRAGLGLTKAYMLRREVERCRS